MPSTCPRATSLLASAALLLAGASLVGCGGTSGGGGGPAGVTNDLVLFVSDGRQAGVFELFASEANGANLRVLSGPIVPTADVTAFAWSPGRTFVAFVADRDTDGQSELYMSDLVGNGPFKVSSPLIASGDVADDIAWSSDSVYVAYRADANVVVKQELFVTTPNGGALRVSSASMDDNGGVQDFAWQPGGSRLAFLADNAGTGAFRINLVGADGTGFQQVNSAGPQSAYRWAPDGSRLAWLDDPLNNGRVGLFTIDPFGAGLQDLSQTLSATNPTCEVTSYDWRLDGQKLAFVSDRDVDGRADAWVANATGGGLLNIVTAPATSDVLDLAYSPSGAFLVAYRIDDAVTNLPELHVVFDTNVGESTLVEDDGTQGVGAWEWAPDGNRIAYLADHNVNGAPDLFTVVVPGGPIVNTPHSSMGTGEQVFDFAWSPDSTRLLFTSDDDAPAFGVRDLFRATVGGPTARLTTNANAGNDVEQYGWSFDGAAMAWIDGLTLLDPMHLFTGDLNGANQVNVSLPLDPPLVDVPFFEIR